MEAYPRTHSSRFMSYKASRRHKRQTGGSLTSKARAGKSMKGGSLTDAGAYVRDNVIRPYIGPLVRGLHDGVENWRDGGYRGGVEGHLLAGAALHVGGRKLEKAVFKNPYIAPAIVGAANGAWEAGLNRAGEATFVSDVALGALQGAGKELALRGVERQLTRQKGWGLRRPKKAGAVRGGSMSGKKVKRLLKGAALAGTAAGTAMLLAEDAETIRKNMIPVVLHTAGQALTSYPFPRA